MRSCKERRAVTLSPTTNKSSISQCILGTTLRKFCVANFNPSTPCGRPFGNVLSKNFSVTVCERSSLPVSQNA